MAHAITFGKILLLFKNRSKSGCGFFSVFDQKPHAYRLYAMTVISGEKQRLKVLPEEN